jgi:hypothetical protein
MILENIWEFWEDLIKHCADLQSYKSYCDEPLLCNERFSADVIAMATNTENQPISRDGYAKYYYRDNQCAFPRRPTENNAFRKG